MTYDLYQLSKTRGKDGSLKLGIRDEQRRKVRQSAAKGERTVEDVFIESLVAAGACRHHSGAVRPLGIAAWRTNAKRKANRPHGAQWQSLRSFSAERCRRQTAVAAMPMPEDRSSISPEITREEYHDLVNTYDSPSDLWDKPEHALRRPPPTPLAPRLVIPPEKEDKPPYAARLILKPEDREHEEQLETLQHLLDRNLGHVSLTKLWDTYQSLRSPRLRYIADDDIRLAFRHLNWVEFRSQENAMPRYLSLLEDCLAENIPITTAEWNNAIAFAGRWVRYATTTEVRAAIETWMRMEAHNVSPDHVTFNILFDVAIKAGRFALADTIFNELKVRNMPLNRYFRTSQIYYAGVRGDGSAVRTAFRDLVNGGDIVDTPIMNAVILSLVRAGEPAAAEHVFAKMKKLWAEKMGTEGPRSWYDQKELGHLLDRTANSLRREKRGHEKSFFGSSFSSDDHKGEFQRLAPIAPNERTYRILLGHHCLTSGDLARVQDLLTEMRERNLRVHGSIYVNILRGFWQHGGYAYTAWNRRTLEAFWSDFLLAASNHPTPLTGHAEKLDGYEPEQSEEARPPYFTRALAHAMIRAFYKCAGRPKMLEVWQDVKGRWKDADGEDMVVLEALVRKFVREDSVYVVQ